MAHIIKWSSVAYEPGTLINVQITNCVEVRWRSETLRSQTNMLHNSQRLTITLCFILVASWFHCLLHFYAFDFSLENRFMVTTKFSFWKIFLSYKAGTRLARSTQGFDSRGNLSKSVKIIFVSYLTLKWKDKNKKLYFA